MIKSVIEINGRRYDANTGTRILDETKTIKQSVKLVEPKAKTHAKRQAAAHVKAHAPASSKLLMRNAVKNKKPGVSAKKHLKVNPALTVHTPKLQTPAHRANSHVAHAKQVERSQQISRFHKLEDAFKVQVATVAPATQVDSVVQPSMFFDVTPAKQSLDDMLDAALQAATAHTLDPLPKPRRHFIKHKSLFGRIKTQTA